MAWVLAGGTAGGTASGDGVTGAFIEALPFITPFMLLRINGEGELGTTFRTPAANGEGVPGALLPPFVRGFGVEEWPR